MILQAFFDSGFSEVPESLVLRAKGQFYIMGLIIFSSFVMLALVRKENHRFIQILMQLLTTGGNLDQRLKETMRPGSRSSILLMVNYTLMFSVCIYLGLSFTGLLDGSMQLIVSAALPILLLVLQLLPLVFITGITGVSLPTSTIIANNFVGGQLGGIMLLILALVWSLNPVLGPQAFPLFGIVIGAIHLSRVFKNSFLLLSSGVSWYYILLYFCTLEILPLFLATCYVLLNF